MCIWSFHLLFVCSQVGFSRVEVDFRAAFDGAVAVADGQNIHRPVSLLAYNIAKLYNKLK